MEKVIILYSGGLDSTILLKGALAMGLKPHCVFIDYEQLHIDEKAAALKICHKLKVPVQVVKLHGLGITSKLTKPDKNKVKDNTISEWYVPARNLMFVSIVASIAESMGIENIWYGANYEDRINLFPDCTQEWVFEMNRLLEINSNFKVTLSAPLIGVSNTQLELIGNKFNINKSEIFSGYGKLK